MKTESQTTNNNKNIKETEKANFISRISLSSSPQLLQPKFKRRRATLYAASIAAATWTARQRIKLGWTGEPNQPQRCWCCRMVDAKSYYSTIYPLKYDPQLNLDVLRNRDAQLGFRIYNSQRFRWEVHVVNLVSVWCKSTHSRDSENEFSWITFMVRTTNGSYVQQTDA